jgi:myosin-crossreactive antigen
MYTWYVSDHFQLSEEVTHLDYTRKAERISLEILALTSRGHFLCLDFWARWANMAAPHKWKCGVDLL